MEAMLAARIVSAHHAAMDCFRRAARHDIDDNAALRLQGKALSLANLALRTLRELRKCQAQPPAYPVAEAPQAPPEPPIANHLPAAQPPSYSATVVPATQPDAPYIPVMGHALARNGPSAATLAA
jgi:hypothetical protein